jgi:hypothetical protein
VKKTKTLGIAIAMALALTAIAGAASASASVFLNPGAGAAEGRTWTGVRAGVNHNLTLPGESIGCSDVSFSGAMTGPSGKEILVAPQLSKCVWGGLPVSFAMNGCKYRLRPGTGTGSSSTGWLDIVGCASPMSFEAGGCVVQIGSQHGVGTIQYNSTEVEKNKTVNMIANLSGLEFTRKGACFGAPGTYTTGTYTGEWLVKGFNSKGEQKPIAVEGTGGTSSGFVVEEAPAIFGGERSGTNKAFLDTGSNGTVTCSTRSFAGSSAAVSFEIMTLTPTYSGCKLAGQTASVSTGGCSYEFHRNGGFAIVGGGCAASPISFTAGGCTVTIGPQSGLSGVTYTNEGAGKLSSLITGGEAKGLTVTAAGFGCSVPGTSSIGVYKAVDRFTAANSSGKQQALWAE